MPKRVVKNSHGKDRRDELALDSGPSRHLISRSTQECDDHASATGIHGLRREHGSKPERRPGPGAFENEGAETLVMLTTMLEVP